MPSKHIHIMGVVNLTPDSFYAASRSAGAEALARIRAMQASGAHCVDIGACSTRPGSAQPSLEEEWERLSPVLSALDSGEGISIDTYRAEIVRRAYDTVGPFLVNDVSAGSLDPQMLSTVGRLGLPYVAMHMRGTPASMQALTDYEDVVEEVLTYFRAFSRRAAWAGVQDWLLDPGFGFAKTTAQNYELLWRLEELREAGRPVLVGLSRKSMIYKLLGITPEEAMPLTMTLQWAALQRGATWLRTHDVPETAALVNRYLDQQ